MLWEVGWKIVREAVIIVNGWEPCAHPNDSASHSTQNVSGRRVRVLVLIVGPLAWFAYVNCDVGRAKRAHILMEDEMHTPDTVDMRHEDASFDVTCSSADSRFFAKACGHDRDIMGLHMRRPAVHTVLSKFISVVQRRVAVWAEDAHVHDWSWTAAYVRCQRLA